MKTIILSLLSVFVLTGIQAQTAPTINWQTAATNLSSNTILETEDLDGDGVKEIIVSNTVRHSNFNLLSYVSTMVYDTSKLQYVVDKVSLSYEDQITAISAIDMDGDGQKELFLGFMGGNLRVLDGTDFSEKILLNILKGNNSSQQFPSFKFNDIKFIDHEGVENDLFCFVLSEGTMFYDASLNYLGRSVGGSGTQLEIANLDADPALEFIYSSGDMYELDGINLSPQFDFGNVRAPIALKDLNGDGTLDVIYSLGQFLRAKDVVTGQDLWTARFSLSSLPNATINGVWLMDYDGDGVEEVAISHVNFGGLHIYDAATGTKKGSIEHPADFGVRTLVQVDANNELLFLAKSDDERFNNRLMRYSLQDETFDYAFKKNVNDFSVFETGDIDNDGQEEFIVSTTHRVSGSLTEGSLTIYDGLSKAVVWSYDSAEEDTNMVVSAIRIADLDGDGLNELLLGLDLGDRKVIRVFTAEFVLKKEFEVNDFAVIRELEVADLDGDGINEMVVISRLENDDFEEEAGEFGAYLYILDSQTGEFKWSSIDASSIFVRFQNIQIGDIDEDDNLEVVVLQKALNGPGVTVFVIDGVTNAVYKKNFENINTAHLMDVDQDGKDELVAGTEFNKIDIYKGSRLVLEQTISFAEPLNIQAINSYDFDGDGTNELIFSADKGLYIYSLNQAKTQWVSDFLFFDIVGKGDETIKVVDLDKDQKIEVLFSGGHRLISYEIEDYSLLAPMPKVLNPIQYFRVNKNSETEPLFGTVQASDINGESLQYSLLTEFSSIAIDAQTGALSVVGSLEDDFLIDQFLNATVEVTNVSGGKSNIYIIITYIDENDDFTSTTNTLTESMVVYPNPTKGVLHFKTGLKGQVIVRDIMGTLVLAAPSTNLDLSALPAGVYLIDFIDSEGILQSQHRVLKQ